MGSSGPFGAPGPLEMSGRPETSGPTGLSSTTPLPSAGSGFRMDGRSLVAFGRGSLETMGLDPRTMRVAQRMPSSSRTAADARVAQPRGSRTRNAASEGAVRARTPRKAGAIAATTRADSRAWAVAAILACLDRIRSAAAAATPASTGPGGAPVVSARSSASPASTSSGSPSALAAVASAEPVPAPSSAAWIAWPRTPSRAGGAPSEAACRARRGLIPAATVARRTSTTSGTASSISRRNAAGRPGHGRRASSPWSWRAGSSRAAGSPGELGARERDDEGRPVDAGDRRSRGRRARDADRCDGLRDRRRHGNNQRSHNALPRDGPRLGRAGEARRAGRAVPVMGGRGIVARSGGRPGPTRTVIGRGSSGTGPGPFRRDGRARTRGGRRGRGGRPSGERGRLRRDHR
jgi:hypothetical protein